jgi:hypothetical protein
MAARLGIMAFLGLSVVAILGAWLWHRLRPVERYEIGEVADASGLVITAANAPVVVEWIARTRLWRTVGVLAALAGMVAWAVVQWSTARSLTITLTVLLWGLIGYWVGSVVAELGTARALTGDGPRSASLAPREMAQYVGRWASRWPLRLAVVGGVSMLVALGLGGGTWWNWACGLGTIVVAAVTRAVSRYVLDRPQPVQADDVAAADDAVRSRSLHALGGTAVGIEIWLASLAFGGAVSVAIARFGVQPAVEGGDGATSLLGFATAVVLLSYAVLIPVVGFIVGRRLARRPFAVRPPVGAAR